MDYVNLFLPSPAAGRYHNSMPDKRTHRGRHPEDAGLFAPAAVPALRAAVADFSLLLTKGYAEKSTLKLVGDRFKLTDRQRSAVLRSACSNQQLNRRLSRQVALSAIRDQNLAIDGYNILITIEAAISGGVLFIARDSTYRDIASIHGTYRKVTETVPAIELIGQHLAALGLRSAEWFLDSPVSNSGRLKTLICQIARDHHWPWQVRLTFNPDAELIKTDCIVASSDSVILDACYRWTNLAAEIISQKIPSAIVIDLSNP